MRLKLFIACALLIGSSATHAQQIEEYPSVVFSASFKRDFHIEKLLAGASIAGRLDDATGTVPLVKPIPMLAAEWQAGVQPENFKITLMGVPVDSKHRLDATGDGGSNWGWWVLGGVGAVAIAAVAISAGGGSDSHPQTPANCTNSTGLGPASIQNCPQ